MLQKTCKWNEHGEQYTSAKLVLPNMTLQQFSTQMILSRGARYDLIFNNSSGCQRVCKKSHHEGNRISPCCANFRNRRPLSPTAGISRCSSFTHP